MFLLTYFINFIFALVIYFIKQDDLIIVGLILEVQSFLPILDDPSFHRDLGDPFYFHLILEYPSSLLILDDLTSPLIWANPSFGLILEFRLILEYLSFHPALNDLIDFHLSCHLILDDLSCHLL